jgi:hypothetical protein
MAKKDEGGNMQLSRGAVEGLLDLYRLSREASEEVERRREAGKVSQTDAIMEGLTSPSVNKFFCVVANLEPKARAELVALMWLGRDEEYTKDDFPSLLERAINQGWEGDAEYLDGKIYLEDYLVEALTKMGL